MTTIHQKQTHPTFVEGCFGCKVSTIRFGTVPGASQDSKKNHSTLRQREKDLHRYAAKRKAGEKPEGTTRKAMERSEHKADIWDRKEKDIRDYNPPSKVAEIKKQLTGHGE